MKPLTFVTLGPDGANHALNTQRYLAFHGIEAEVVLIDDFFDGLSMSQRGEADHMVQVAVHPDCGDGVARGQFEFGVHLIDSVLAPSQELAVLTCRKVTQPRTLALQPATRADTDLSVWPEHVAVSAIMRIAEGLLAAHYDSVLTTLDIAKARPDKFRVDASIGTVEDAWLVFGRTRVVRGDVIAWPDSPGAQHLRQAGRVPGPRG